MTKGKTQQVNTELKTTENNHQDLADYLSNYSDYIIESYFNGGILTESEIINRDSGLYPDQIGINVIKSMRQEIVSDLRNRSYPWLQNICQIRGAYLFGSGLFFENAEKELEAIRTNPRSKDILSFEWLQRYNQELLCAGNVFMVRHKPSNHYFMLDINQVDETVADLDDNAFITYILRTDMNNKQYFIKRHGINQGRADTKVLNTLRYPGSNIEINQDYEFWHFSTVKNADEPLAVPLLLKALPWTRAAARYLSNVLAFKTGQMKIAVKFRGSTKDGPANALKVISGTDKVGGFAGMQGVDVSNMAANGLNISNTGQIEFLAPAAAAMTIPVNALSESMLGSAGTEGGLKTLDTPTQNYYLGERRILKDNIEELLGGTAKVRFVPISAEEQKTEVEQMFIAMQEGVISLKDYRNFLANFYQLGFRGKLPSFKETYKAQAMRYQFELNKEFATASSDTDPDDEIDIDDPTNEGGANDDREDDTGQPGPGKRTKVTKNSVL